MINIITRLIDLNAREIRRISKKVEEINSLEDRIKKLKDSDFPKQTEKLKRRIKEGEDIQKILPEAYALVREAASRSLGQRPYDVQLIAGVALFEGNVAEQRTGEGKTLTAAAPLYLRALEGKGVHLVTVNDYLARVGAGWNAPVYEFLGLTVGVISQEQKSYIYDTNYSDKSHGDERLEHLKPCDRKVAYAADITYGTNNEFGFDYLRDNMVPSVDRMVQRGHHFAIVDEVDQVLIDEARTPLIISAPDSEPTEKYYQFSKIIDNLNEDDYTIDEKSRTATLTEKGITTVEKVMKIKNLYEEDFEAIHHIENALRARTLYLKDKEYIVKDDQIIIVDEFTGRLMPGRRWSDGLHQAIEAKEGVKIQQESKTMATISFQNYFRMYEHLSGMTGTAATEADEFKKIYNLDVLVIPTHRPITRKDNSDLIYKTTRAKYEAVAIDIAERHKNGQPVLVGTTSVEKNEIISTFLKKKKIPHNVLNAKNHEKEASIISEAGKPGAVTVATNMAGRGVDIILGGSKPDHDPEVAIDKYQDTKEYKEWEKKHEAVVASGGLMVLGTERHESRRIDNQLRGRAGRQGDPGASRFYLSLEDDLMRIFGGDQISRVMDRLNLPEDQPIENGLVSRAIEQSQVKVEGFHFDQRKRLVEYDDVANQQREIVYKLRKRVLDSEDLKEEVLEKIEIRVSEILDEVWTDDEKIDIKRLLISFSEIIPFDDASRKRLETLFSPIEEKEKLLEALKKIVHDTYESREKTLGSEIMRRVEKYAYLGAIDHLWIDHIDHIDSLREGVTLRAYGQRDPLVEFKNEAFSLFESLLVKIDDELSTRIFRMQVSSPHLEIPLDKIQTNEDTSDDTGLVEPESKKTLGRNDPCWCGSGKKWKKCHYPKMG